MYSDRYVTDHKNKAVFVSNHSHTYVLYEAKVVADELEYSFYIVDSGDDVTSIQEVLSESR